MNARMSPNNKLRLLVDMKYAVIRRSYRLNAAVRKLQKRFIQGQKHVNTVCYENLMKESITPLKKEWVIH